MRRISHMVWTDSTPSLIFWDHGTTLIRDDVKIVPTGKRTTIGHSSAQANRTLWRWIFSREHG